MYTKMVANLKVLAGFEVFDEDTDLILLFEWVKSIVFNFEVTKSLLPDALVLAMKLFYKLYQYKTMVDS